MLEIFKFNALLKRNVRRGLVVVALATLVLYHVLGLFTNRFLGSGILLILLYWMLFTRLSCSTSLFRGGKLDERQQSLRNQAFYLTYLIAAPFAIAMYFLIVYDVGAVKFYFQNSKLTEVLGYVNMSLVVSLPVMYVAWLEPDPIEEDASTENTRGLA